MVTQGEGNGDILSLFQPSSTTAQENGNPPLAKVEQSNHSQDDDVEALSQELEKERLVYTPSSI